MRARSTSCHAKASPRRSVSVPVATRGDSTANRTGGGWWQYEGAMPRPRPPEASPWRLTKALYQAENPRVGCHARGMSALRPKEGLPARSAAETSTEPPLVVHHATPPSFRISNQRDASGRVSRHGQRLVDDLSKALAGVSLACVVGLKGLVEEGSV